MKDDYDYITYVPEDEKDIMERMRKKDKRAMLVSQITTLIVVGAIALIALYFILFKNGVIASWR